MAADIRHLLKLLEPEDLVRIEVTNLDAWANGFLAECGKPMRLATETDRRQAWDRAMALWEVPGYTRSFFDAEWGDVYLAQDIQDVDSYVRAVRIGRGVSVGRAERRQLWEVFAEYRDQLQTKELSRLREILRLARRELESQGKPQRYRSVIVDETQDISPEGLKLLRAIAGPERPDDMFLVGDAQINESTGAHSTWAMWDSCSWQTLTHFARQLPNHGCYLPVVFGDSRARRLRRPRRGSS